MLNQYETVFIMTPVLSDEQMKETVKKFENILTSNGAEMIHEEDWGLRKFEYPIQKKSSGFYHLFEFKAEGSVVKELELQYRRDERVLRYLTVAMDKHAVAYSEKRRNLKKEPTKYKQFIRNCFELCPRQALHARTLGFVHPSTGKWMQFESALPADMGALLDKWRAYTTSGRAVTLPDED